MLQRVAQLLRRVVPNHPPPHLAERVCSREESAAAASMAQALTVELLHMLMQRLQLNIQ